MLNEDKAKDLVFKQEIKDAFEQNVQWSGSSELMWQKIQARVKPVPWHKEYRNWLTTAAVAMIFIIILINPINNLPVKEPSDNLITIETETHGQVYRSSPQDVEMPVQLFSTKMATMSLEPVKPVTATINLPEQIMAGSSMNVEIELQTDQANLAVSSPVLSLMSTTGDAKTIAEIPLTSWVDLILFGGEPANLIIVVDTPQSPGFYELELNLILEQNEQEDFISKSITFQVNN